MLSYDVITALHSGSFQVSPWLQDMTLFLKELVYKLWKILHKLFNLQTSNLPCDKKTFDGPHLKFFNEKIYFKYFMYIFENDAVAYRLPIPLGNIHLCFREGNVTTIDHWHVRLIPIGGSNLTYVSEQ